MRHPSSLLLLAFSLLAYLHSQAQQTEIQYLSGTGKDHTVDWEFHIDRGMNSGKWTTIPVPSNWEIQGFGVYNYGRGKQPESDETGQYRHRFSVPQAWKGRAVNIVFEGAMTDTYVKANGKSAGPVHQGSFYRFKYDISELLNYGEENLLEVTVKNWSDNESVNLAERHADFWIFGGIYRPVYLEAHPRQHIEWTAIDARHDGALYVDVYLKNNRNLSRLEGQVETLDGGEVGTPFDISLARGAEKARLSTRILNPRPWSPEFPHRYQLKLTAYDEDGPVHIIVEKFGFRTVELREQDGFYVNGVKVRFKGVNRHSAWPESGRTTSRELSIMDVQLMKDMNMNAVRMSHYPPDEHFLDACDSLGLFVIDELTGWQDAYDTIVGEKLVREMLIRDVNHPSTVIWANGNEGGNNHDLVDDYHIYDPQKRPVIHPWAIFRGTDTNHYKDWDCCANSLYHGSEVFFPTEILHGLYDGGHGAGLEDYWKLGLDNPLFAGLFLWVFADEGMLRRDDNNRMDTNGSNAPDGIVGPFREKEGSFYTIKEVWSPVQPQLKQLGSTFEGRLPLANHYHYTNLSQCRFEWALARFDGSSLLKAEKKITASGEAATPDIAPGKEGEILLKLPDNWRQNDALYFTAYDPHGRELYRWSWPLQKAKAIAGRIAGGSQGGRSATAETEGTDILLRGGEIAVRISRQTGLISGVVSSGQPISFGNGPQADTLLGPTQLEAVRHYTDGSDQVVEVQFAGSQASIMKKLQYRMRPDGLLQLHAEYLPRQGHYDYVGLNFDYPEEQVKGVRWLGHGPYRAWKNRLPGIELDIWEKAYNNTVTGESGWEYPEFKGYHAGLYWAVIDSKEKPFAIIAETDGLFLRLFTPEPPQGAYNDHTDGVFPSGDISLLHGISPIGTKFREAERTGPQGRPNMVFYHRSATNLSVKIWLDFNVE